MGQFHRFWQPLLWPVIGAAAACAAGVVLGRWSWAVAVALALGFHEVRGVDQFWHWPVSIVVVLALIATIVRVRLPLRDRLPGGGSPAAGVLVAGALAAFVANWAPTVWREAKAGPYRGPPAFQTVESTPGAIAYFRDLAGAPPVVLAALYEQLGYAFALFLLLSGRYIEWILMLFPLWVLLISLYILIDNLRRPSQAGASPGAN
jgi:uncharacterized membrane protein